MLNLAKQNRHQQTQQMFIRTLTELSQLSVSKQRYEEGNPHNLSESLYLAICNQMKEAHKKLQHISRCRIGTSGLWSDQTSAEKTAITSAISTQDLRGSYFSNVP